MLVALWSLTHRYKGLGGDAELYAVQALARIHRGLAHDLFLQNASQDNYTIFSPFYAWCIGCLGLRHAALSLMVLFKLWLLAAAWALARTLSSARTAFVAVALVMITVGSYGAYGVFRYAEDWLTARSLAEAMVVSAVALHFYGHRLFALLVALLALFVHPIMALPGLLVLACLWLPLRVSLCAAAAGVLVSLGVSLWALHAPSPTGLLVLMDREWLEVVRERSVFLFPQLWSADDWKNNARPFISLTLIAISMHDRRITSLCTGSMLVGATGVAVALIAGLVGPLAIFIQCQVWRWLWIGSFLGILLLAPAAAVIYRDKTCGPACSLLLISGWLFPPIDGTACAALALALWLARKRINSNAAKYLRWGAAALGVIISVWMAFNAWSSAFTPVPDTGREAVIVGRLRNVLGLEIPAALLIFLLSHWIDKTRSRTVLAAISLCVGASAAFVMQGALQDISREGAPAEVDEFADWRAAIPLDSSVYVVPMYNSATFAWFTLERPSYLSVDQSAGVVFSRATSMEVKRRSQVLLPMLDPDWRLLTRMNIVRGSSPSRDGAPRAEQHGARPLTKERLARVCRDPVLGFVVARENVGYRPITHQHVGKWKDWNLYDCGRVRSETPDT